MRRLVCAYNRTRWPSGRDSHAGRAPEALPSSQPRLRLYSPTPVDRQRLGFAPGWGSWQRPFSATALFIQSALVKLRRTVMVQARRCACFRQFVYVGYDLIYLSQPSQIISSPDFRPFLATVIYDTAFCKLSTENSSSINVVNSQKKKKRVSALASLTHDIPRPRKLSSATFLPRHGVFGYAGHGDRQSWLVFLEVQVVKYVSRDV